MGKEFKIGDLVRHDDEVLIVEEATKECKYCYFNRSRSCTECLDRIKPRCVGANRTDGKDIIYRRLYRPSLRTKRLAKNEFD